jgi:hypothetical protein
VSVSPEREPRLHDVPKRYFRGAISHALERIDLSVYASKELGDDARRNAKLESVH